LKYGILVAILILSDIEMMYLVAWRLGLAERIVCAFLLFGHTIWFFLICYFQIRKQKWVTNKHPQ
jgi:NADH:ubiquinone oxidoreductase subunit 3 (subunit A)